MPRYVAKRLHVHQKAAWDTTPDWRSRRVCRHPCGRHYRCRTRRWNRPGAASRTGRHDHPGYSRIHNDICRRFSSLIMSDNTLQHANAKAGHVTSTDTIIQIISRGLLLAAFVILLFYFAVYVVYAINLAQFPFDYDQGEGFELVDVLMLSQGEWPYADIETYPFYGSIYPPVYHMMLVPFAWVFGPEYWYGRLFSFATTLITAVAIGIAVYREERNRTAAIFAGLVYLASPTIYHTGPLLRQHIIMVVFEMLAVLFFARAVELDDTQRRRRYLLGGFALLILAGYTKQLAAFTAGSVLVFLFIRNPRQCLVWGTGFATVGVAIFAFLTLATDGHWWTQTITANVKDFDPQQAMGLLRQFWEFHGFLIIPAMLVVLHDLYFSRISIYSVWFIGATAFNAMAAGTWGAGDSYYSTSIAAVSVLSGIFAARTLNRHWTFNNNLYKRIFINPLRPITSQLTASGLMLVPLLYLGYGSSVLHMPTETPVFAQIADTLGIEDNTGYGFHDPDGYTTYAYARIGHLTTQSDIDAGNRIVDLIREIPADTPILSEEAAFSLITGRDVITNPVVLMILADADAFDSSELVGMIENREFGLIILRARFYPPTVNLAISTHYETDEVIRMNGFDYEILRPIEP